MKREVGGIAAAKLGLTSIPEAEQLKRLLHGLHPVTGEQLTAKLIDNRLTGWDITASIPKGVTIALERGDSRIHDAMWEAARETMGDIEGMIATRQRKGGVHEDRVTGNLMWFGFEHPETRPAKSDGMPDPDRHIHLVVPNLTYDKVEGEWKAIKFRPVMEMRKYFDRAFDARLASKLTDLGYSVATKMKPDKQGGKRYFSWDIAGMPKSVVDKFSRRTGEVETLAADLGISNPTSKDKLGATSRQFKRKDMTLADYRAYWDGRVTPDEARAVAEVIKAAMEGRNPSPRGTTQEAVEYSLSHNFERQSVVLVQQVAITALERGMGVVRPEQLHAEAHRLGLLVKNGEATTRAVLAEETRVIGFARDGRGTCRPMGVGAASPDLSHDQLRIARHVWESTDRVILIRGAAGTGKTHTMKTTIAGIDRPVIVLAPSADASRSVLRKEGFTDADTVAAFLGSKDMQARARGGVIWVDEAGLLGIRQVRQVFDKAEELGARVVLQGDKRQHGSVERGATLRVLEQFAGLPVAQLTDIRRQRGKYKEAVTSLSEGRTTDGYDALNELGWVQTVASNAPLVDDYLAALDAGKEVLAIAPTHAEADEVTAAIRDKLKVRGAIGTDEHIVDTLTPLHWTDAQKGDLDQYDGTEVIQFHRNSGTFKAGQRVAITDFKVGDKLGAASTFAVYGKTTVGLSKGDRIRITSNGWTADKEHRLDNGAQYTVAGFEKDGKIRLTNGWFIAPDFPHISHGYVTTSHASQGKTVDRVLIAMGQESLGAIGAEQLYVSVSRGREKATIYTDVSPEVLREAVQKADSRKSATELMQPKPRRREWWISRRARAAWDSLRTRAGAGMPEKTREKEYGYER